MSDTILSQDIPSGVVTPDTQHPLLNVGEEFAKAIGVMPGGKHAEPEPAKAPDAPAKPSDPVKETPAAPAEPAPKENKSPFSLPKKDKADAAPATDPDAPDFVKGKSEKSAQWAALKQEKEAALARVASVEANYKAQLEKITKERDEYSQTARMANAESAPEVKNLEAARARSQGEIKKLAGENGDKLAELAVLPDSPWKDAQINEAISELPPVIQGQVTYRLAQIKDLNDARTATLQKIAAEREGVVAGESQRQEAVRADAEKMFSTVAADAAAHLDLLQPIEGNDAHNNRIAQLQDTAKNLFMGSMTPQDVATATIWAAIAPELYQQRSVLLAENVALKKQLSGMKAATPGVTSSAKGAEKATEKGFVESIMAEIRG